MMPINFYKQGSPRQHKSIARWFKLSVCMLFLVISWCATLYLQESYTRTTLNSQKGNIELQYKQLAWLAQLRHTKEALGLILQKNYKIRHYAHNVQSMLDLIKNTQNSLHGHTFIEKMCMDGKEVEIKIGGEDTQAVLEVADFLNVTHQVNPVHITAIEHTRKNQLLATLRCTMISRENHIET